MKKLPHLTLSLVLALAGFYTARAQVTISNGFYDVHIDNDGSNNGLGSWNAVTGTSHPVGGGHNLLYNDTTTSTNFSTLRVYSADGPIIDYTAKNPYTSTGLGGGTSWDGFLTSAGTSTTYVPNGQGYKMEWNLGTGLTFSQELAVTGTTYANSAIYHTVTVTNTTGSNIGIGWRNLYDWAVNDPGFDDGPSNAIEIGGVPTVASSVMEFDYTPVAGSYVRVSAAPAPGGGATYEPLLGLGYDPGFIAALPVTMPEKYSYVSWPDADGTAFDYSTSGLDVGSLTGGIDDSAGLSWFGRTADSAIQVGAGQTVRFTQTIYAVPPGAQPGQTVPDAASTLALLGGALTSLALLRRRFGR